MTTGLYGWVVKGEKILQKNLHKREKGCPDITETASSYFKIIIFPFNKPDLIAF